MDVRLLKLLDHREDKYPHALEQQYRRVLNNIMRLWDSPEIDNYFSDLLVSSRANRKGFPPEVAVGIAYLSVVHNHQVHEPVDPWSNIAGAGKLKNQMHEDMYAPPAFFKACEKGKRDVIVMYLSVGISVNACDERLWTPLIICASSGNDKLAALLLKIGANIHQQDKVGFTALHWAAYNGHTKMVNMLLDKEAKVNAANNKGLTPLAQAAARGNLDVVALLLERGADVNTVASDGSTPLHKATANCHVSTVAFLLNKGADTVATLNTGETPLDLAIKSQHPQLLSLLASRR
jgi:ankyrin repeat protein